MSRCEQQNSEAKTHLASTNIASFCCSGVSAAEWTLDSEDTVATNEIMSSITRFQETLPLAVRRHISRMASVSATMTGTKNHARCAEDGQTADDRPQAAPRMPSPQSRVVRSPFGETLESRALTLVALNIVDIFQRRETLIKEPGAMRLAKGRVKNGGRTPWNFFEKRGDRFPQAEEDVTSVESPRDNHVGLSESCFRLFEIGAGYTRAVSAEKKDQICTRRESVIHRRDQAHAQVAVRLRNEIGPSTRTALQPCAHFGFGIRWSKVNHDAPACGNLRQLMLDEGTIDSGRAFGSDRAC
jgi:hypothetical protein